MIAAWMLQAVVVSLLLALAAWTCDALLGLYRLPRRGVWLAAALAAVVLPLASLLPRDEEAAPPAAAAVAAIPDVAASRTSGDGDVARTASGVPRALQSATAGFAAVAGAVARQPVLGPALATSWLLAAGVLLSVLLVSAHRFLRRRVSWREHMLAGTRVYVTRDDGPAVVGLRRPTIIVPSWLLADDADRQRMVVQHEREHVRRGDHLLMGGAAALATLLPWNLPLQWMLRRLRLAVELDCDRRVLAAGVPPRAYGALLIDIAARTRRVPLAVALTGGETELERRIRAMTWKLPTFRRVRVAAGAVCAAALVLLACDVDLLDPALQQATVGEVVDAAVAAEPGLAAAAAQARYFVDGREVTLTEIRDQQVAEFARVDVVRGEHSASGATELRLRTNAGADVHARAARVPSPRPALTARPDSMAVRGAVAVELRRAAATAVRTDGVPLPASPQRGVLRSNVTPADSLRIASVRGAAAATLRGALTAYPTDTLARRRNAEALRPPSAAFAGRAAVYVDGVPVRVRTDSISADRRVISGNAARLHVDAARLHVDAVPIRNAPLFIVDGVIVSGERLDLNALDIQSIEVIKGEAARQLYGDRGAHGVIRITTRH